MKNIVVLTECQENRTRVETFKEAYELMRKRYINNGFLYEDEWEEEYPEDKITEEFKADGYIEFCDGDCIATVEKFLEYFFD